ncbi:ketopantoate reductase family protein [Macrococcus capreoli]|uniref:ketopantoate reductase family protein n=1 Tax=Macrococcus capreoli TaxID=2982690 RepID=UPI0021D5ECF7|nr:2-dehydropantoate 2-reductase [Macrococcus sp. TMW 2.2395]MCU7557241.1 2-dehydropantoate 2-reductase [Macrococcus sp. TMW 2.2395]
MKIAIAGAGAMGGRVGLYLTESGQDVVLLDKWQEHVDAMNHNGITVNAYGEQTNHKVKAEFMDNYKEPVDLVILLTKALTAEETIDNLIAQGVITDDTKVMSLMNGLGHGDMLLKKLNHEQVILAVTMWSAGLKGPGELILEGSGNIEFGYPDGHMDAFIENLKVILDQAQLNGVISNDIVTTIWNKALVNCCFNTYCSVTDKRIGEFGAYEKADEMLIPLVKEIIAVGATKGAKLDLDATMDKFHKMYSPDVVGLHYPSMTQDIHNGRKTEVDFLTGAVSRFGDEAGIETPYCDILTHLVHQIEK